MSNQPGKLYIVATPIGNLEDLTARAIRVLREADIIAAEDTRHSRVLLEHYGIQTRTVSCHEHNERQASADLLKRLLAGESVALVTDAGTPLISDPGFPLVSLAHDAGVQVVPVPGASALVTALSACGLPVHRFTFEGYPPPKSAARRKWLEGLRSETRTIVFYETPHRILECLEDCTAVFGRQRRCTVARELTKKFESITRLPLGEMLEWMGAEPVRSRGEIVVIIEGAAEESAGGRDVALLLRALLRHLPAGQAAAAAAEITGARKNELYKLALELKEDGE